jgi:hypothetical protein
MSVVEDFVERLAEGRIVFLAGSGVSKVSGAPMSWDILAASARVFLPTDERSGPLVDEVLKGRPGAASDGIQPEIFYEHLLSICGHPDMLALWQVLSPIWLREQHAELLPNTNHLAIVQYAARHRVPIFTMNFDMLFEAAAAKLGLGAPSTWTGGRGPASAKTFAAVDEWETHEAPLRLFKLHGSVETDGAESLGRLATTMQGISTVNQPMIDYMKKICQQRTLAFIGYSGRDIDYFPVLAGMRFDEPPYWFTPDAHDATRRNADRIKARRIDRDPAALFIEHGLAPATIVPPFDGKALLKRLEQAMTVRFAESQKLLFLALCLQSVGRNRLAHDVVQQVLDAPGLPPRDRIAAFLLRARIEDCTSQYVQSEASADCALAHVAAARKSKTIASTDATAFRARALYHRGMARQQQIGPAIDYGTEMLDWRPPKTAMIRQLISGFWLTLRLTVLAWRLPGPNAGSATIGSIRATHVVSDHKIMLAGALMEGLKMLKLARPLSPVLHWWLNRFRSRASNCGDYFAYANANKYLRRMHGNDEYDEAGETYRLLRDPLNYALVRRDSACASLRSGNLEAAADEFRAAETASVDCDSPATEIKSLTGLVACGVFNSSDAARLAKVARMAEGKGYRTYRMTRVEPFLAMYGQ